MSASQYTVKHVCANELFVHPFVFTVDNLNLHFCGMCVCVCVCVCDIATLKHLVNKNSVPYNSTIDSPILKMRNLQLFDIEEISSLQKKKN